MTKSPVKQKYRSLRRNEITGKTVGGGELFFTFTCICTLDSGGGNKGLQDFPLWEVF